MSTYPEKCFSDLIGVRGICEPKSDVIYWLDDIPGISLDTLAKLANDKAPTGAKFADRIIESASRFVAADIEAIYDGGYKVEAMLVGGCSSCSFMNSYLAGTELGVMIKNNASSSLSELLLDKLTVKLNSTGTFTIVITDEVTQKTIVHDFTALVEYEFVNINYSTKQKKIRVFIEEPEALLARVQCPTGGGGCGCSGKTRVLSDLVYSGTSNGDESQNAYGFLPCAMIRCQAEDVLCFVAKSAPRMVGMALLYKTAEIYFAENFLSQRNNKVAGFNPEEKNLESAKYLKLYTDKLIGKGTRGVKDIVLTTLQNTPDVCISCTALNSTAWAST